MKKMFVMMMAVVLMLVSAVGGASAEEEYMEGFMIVEINGTEYFLYQEESTSTNRGNRTSLKFVCLDANNKPFFRVYLSFGDGISVGTTTTNYGGQPVSIRLYDYSAGYTTYEAKKDKQYSSSLNINYSRDVGYLEMYVEERIDNGRFYSGYFGAVLEQENGYGEIEIIGGFIAEI